MLLLACRGVPGDGLPKAASRAEVDELETAVPLPVGPTEFDKKVGGFDVTMAHAPAGQILERGQSLSRRLAQPGPSSPRIAIGDPVEEVSTADVVRREERRLLGRLSEVPDSRDVGVVKTREGQELLCELTAPERSAIAQALHRDQGVGAIAVHREEYFALRARAQRTQNGVTSREAHWRW